jgi:hypothetical protein
MSNNVPHLYLNVCTCVYIYIYIYIYIYVYVESPRSMRTRAYRELPVTHGNPTHIARLCPSPSLRFLRLSCNMIGPSWSFHCHVGTESRPCAHVHIKLGVYTDVNALNVFVENLFELFSSHFLWGWLSWSQNHSYKSWMTNFNKICWQKCPTTCLISI